MPARAQPRFEPCGAVAFIHRFCSSLNAHLQFHCVVIDGVFDSATTGRVIFRATTGVDANACCGTTEGSSLVGLRPATFALGRLRELDPERLRYDHGCECPVSAWRDG